MKLSEYDKVIGAYKTYRYLGYCISVTSGQVIFATAPLYVNGQKINSVIFILAQVYLNGIISYKTVVDNSSKNLHCLHLERSFEVTQGHQPSFANNFWSKIVRDVGRMSVRSSRPDESTDMQYDPFRSPRDLITSLLGFLEFVNSNMHLFRTRKAVPVPCSEFGRPWTQRTNRTPQPLLRL